MFRHANKKENISELINLLSDICKLEYSMIMNYPRLAREMKNKETQDLTEMLGTASIKHADTAAKVLTQLGGTPVWSMAAFPDNLSLVEIFSEQLEKEKIAQKSHQRCAELTGDSLLKHEFISMAEEEKYHIKTVEKILTLLKLEKDREAAKTSVMSGIQ